MDKSLLGMGAQFSEPAWWFKEKASSEAVYLQFPTRSLVRGMLVYLDNDTWRPVDNELLKRLPESEDAKTTWVNHISPAAPDVHFSTSRGTVVRDRVECWNGYIQFYASCSGTWYSVTDLPALY